MANQYEKIPGPGFNGDTADYADKEILYSTHRFTQKGVTLAAGQGVLPAGVALARNSSTKKYVAYVPSGANGTGTPVGFLRRSTDTTGSDVQANIVVSGILKANQLSASGGVSGIVTALNARIDAVGGSDADRFVF